jgi:peptide/nickel transport system permease protein
MATDRPSFTDIDWESTESTTFAISRTALVEIAAFVVILAGFVYDLEFAIERPVLTWPIFFDLTIAEWMFVAVLVILFFNGVIPLARNRRLSAYYWKEFKKNRLAVGSLVFLIGILAIGTIGPIFMKPPDISFTDRLAPPVGVTALINGVEVTGTWEHPLGTTAKGEDILKLIIFGMRVSMMVGLGAVAIAVAIGSVVGTVAAYATSVDRGWIDEALMRYVDIQSVLPTFLVLLLVIYLFGAQLWFIIALYGFFSWEGIARAGRAEALQRTEEEYVQAARAAGANTAWIVRQHLIPNISNTVITYASLLIPAFILGEATLAFLGFSDPAVSSWGRTISIGRNNLSDAWWISTIPGIFLVLTALAFNFVGDALRDALDPRHEVGEER